MDILETERLLIRELQLGDWPALEAILTDEVATRQMHFASWSDKKRRDWFQWCLDNARNPNRDAFNWGIVLKHDGRLIGWLGIGTSSRSGIRGHRGMGYILSRLHWGQGYMTEAVMAVLGHEFGVLGSERVSASCEISNVGSARVMQKVGMVFEKTATEPDFEGNVAERHYYAIDRESFLARS